MNRKYERALREMREIYSNLSDDPKIFGQLDWYIPFPALDPNESNAFEKIMISVRRKLVMLRLKEALSTRAGHLRRTPPSSNKS